jgi:hypothetical protein
MGGRLGEAAAALLLGRHGTQEGGRRRGHKWRGAGQPACPRSVETMMLARSTPPMTTNLASLHDRHRQHHPETRMRQLLDRVRPSTQNRQLLDTACAVSLYVREKSWRSARTHAGRGYAPWTPCLRSCQSAVEMCSSWCPRVWCCGSRHERLTASVLSRAP